MIVFLSIYKNKEYENKKCVKSWISKKMNIDLDLPHVSFNSKDQGSRHPRWHIVQSSDSYSYHHILCLSCSLTSHYFDKIRNQLKLKKTLPPCPSLRTREERIKEARMMMFILRLTDSYRIRPIRTLDKSTYRGDWCSVIISTVQYQR